MRWSPIEGSAYIEPVISLGRMEQAYLASKAQSHPQPATAEPFGASIH